MVDVFRQCLIFTAMALDSCCELHIKKPLYNQKKPYKAMWSHFMSVVVTFMVLVCMLLFVCAHMLHKLHGPRLGRPHASRPPPSRDFDELRSVYNINNYYFVTDIARP